MRKLFTLAALASAFAAASFSAAHAAKFSAQISNFELVPTQVCSATDVQNHLCSNVPWTTVLSTTIKTPNQKDLLINGSLQSAVGTSTTVASKSGTKSTSSASATINVRVLIDGEPATQCGGTSCPNGVAYPYQVTYNGRLQQLSAQLLGLNCTTDLTTGAITCTDPETISLLIQTTSANAFNFVAPNLTAGTHKVELQVNVGTSASSDTIAAGASATAEVGVGTLTVEDVQATNLPNGITFTQ
jgi:hypothetical protein